MIMPGLAEEPGWRGFALPRLQQHYGPLLGSLILEVLHMVWHLPVFFITEGQMAMGPFNAGDFVYKIFTSMVLTVIWTWVFNNTRGSIFMALVLHGAGNAIGMLIHGWGAMFSAAPVSTLGDILLAVCAVLIIVFTRGRLSYVPGLALQPADMPQMEDVPLAQA
jgi:membrane protease YdiL (CAAX protease family)